MNQAMIVDRETSVREKLRLAHLFVRNSLSLAVAAAQVDGALFAGFWVTSQTMHVIAAMASAARTCVIPRSWPFWQKKRAAQGARGQNLQPLNRNEGEMLVGVLVRKAPKHVNVQVSKVRASI